MHNNTRGMLGSTLRDCAAEIRAVARHLRDRHGFLDGVDAARLETQANRLETVADWALEPKRAAMADKFDPFPTVG